MDKGGFIPQSGERALIVGQTGSGKTAFATWLIMRIPIAPIILYDTKEEEKFPKLSNSIIVESMDGVKKHYDDPQVDYIVLRPPVEMLSKPTELDDYLMYHYTHFRHSVAYIDEAYTFHNHGRAGPGLVALFTRGRSRGITTIISTQRPVMVSRFAITEAQKVYAFRLGDKQDRKRLGDVIPNFADLPLPPKHGFYYYESGEDSPELYKPIKLDAALDTGYTDATPEIQDDITGEIENPATKHVWV